MTFQRLAVLLAAATASLSIAPAFAQDYLASPLQLGVYECHDQSYTPTYTMMFGLIDDSTYGDFNGNTGTYAYDETTGILEIGLEKGTPSRFLRIGDGAFRAITSDGNLGGHTCPVNMVKDPANPPW